MSHVLKPTTDLAHRIGLVYPSLSEAHRRAADFVLHNPLETATMTIEGLAERSGTSTATVTRFRSRSPLCRLQRVPGGAV